MDHAALARDVMRALRGRRSQTAFSRRLGYRSNVAHTWESGRAYPTAAVFFRICERAGVDRGAPLSTFYRIVPERLSGVHLTEASGVAALLSDLRGQRSLSDLAKVAQKSRFTIGRWLGGETEPRLPDFLLMVEATSLRVLDFVASVVDPSRLPSVEAEWERLEAARRAAYDMPWSHAVLRFLELPEYQSMPSHRPGWIASQLGIPAEEEARCLELLRRTGQVKERRGRYVMGDALTVDTRRDEERARELKAFWSDASTARLRRGKPGTFSYNLFSVSRKDLERIRDLHTAFFRELRAIVAQSEPVECVALATTHLLAFEGEPARG